LAGLIESDRSIIVPKENSKNTPSITISIHEDDKPFTEKICKTLGYGSLDIIPSSKAVKLSIRGKYFIIKILKLINRNFRTPEIDKLNALINYVNDN
jgi:LAGLIDADG endonuclease